MGSERGTSSLGLSTTVFSTDDLEILGDSMIKTPCIRLVLQVLLSMPLRLEAASLVEPRRPSNDEDAILYVNTLELDHPLAFTLLGSLDHDLILPRSMNDLHCFLPAHSGVKGEDRYE